MSSSKTRFIRFSGRAPGKQRGTVAKAGFMGLCTLAILTLLGTAVAQAQSKQTPARVLDGTAKLTQHYDANQTLRLAFTLTPPHLDEEKKLIDQLHDKKSPLFHKFLTADQFNARFAPTAADEQAMVDWAQSVGLTVTNRFPNRMLVDVEAPAGVIEKALNVTINQYSLGGQTYFSNDRDPLLPGRLSSIVQAVEGLNSFERQVPVTSRGVHTTLPDYTPGAAVSMAVAATGNATSTLKPEKQGSKTDFRPELTNGGFDPRDLYSSQGYNYGALYNQGHCCNPLNNPGNSPPDSSIALATFGDVNYNDIAGFHNTFTYLAYDVQKISIDGGYSCGSGFNDNCLEATLDTEWSLAMANSFGGYGNTAKVYIYESSGSASDMYEQMLTDGNAKVFSTSWGCSDGIGCSASYMSAIDSYFTAMVAQGWSLMAASGDQGATGACSDALIVSFPASDPNVVAVGGTSLIFYSNDTFDYEVAWTGGTGSGACANNDGGGTGGFSSYFGVPSYQSSLASANGWSNRAVPDISLNSGGVGQVVYYNGSTSNWEGTSIASPEMAGFFAQENAYLLAIGNACGSGASACAPLGNPNYSLYGANLQTTAEHYPFYDIVSGCNSNDITAFYGLSAYCAGPGYDLVTGWGSANMLQLAYGINWSIAASAAGPSISYSGPTTGVWYNSNQTVSWTVIDNVTGSDAPTGIAGFTQGWDSIPTDSYEKPVGDRGNLAFGEVDSFYSGPEYPNATSGCLSLVSGGCAGGVSQGCHTANVQAWNNMGVRSGDATYGPICYDTVPPTVTASLSPLPNSAGWNKTTVTVTLTAVDPGGSGASGIVATYYGVLGCSPSNIFLCGGYSGPFPITATYPLSYWTEDRAGNVSSTNSLIVYIDEVPPVTTATLSGTQMGTAYLTPVTVKLTATDNASGVASTTYALDGGPNVAYSAPFIVSAPGNHTLQYFSTDVAGNVEATHTQTFLIQASARSIALDTLTQGTWTGRYGSQGEIIANDVNSPPAYATVSLTGDSPYTWAASTTNASALQTSSGASTRIASTYYSPTSETINLNLTDGNAHRIALYLLDWLSDARTETITITDANNNAVLSTQSYSSFENGEYAVFNISGHVMIQITKTGGSNAVVSGIFFDAPDTTAPATATYVGPDTATAGTWTGKYGSQGQIIASDLNAPPAYATVSLTGDTPYTWAASTTNASALQTSSGSSTRIASTYYSSTSETINLNLTDGNTHRVALYLLDWLANTRTETITVTDANTNAVLSTQSYSSFENGVYAVWNLSGHVLIEITKTGGSNAVVSGIFFDPPATTAATASYLGLDTTTEGSWTGKYGSLGQIIANDLNNPAWYATVSLTGDTVYTWAASTTDPRALQTSSGASTRIASTYFSATSETVNLDVTDGNTHKISLYLLDWDSSSRIETVSILDANTSAVLSTESYATFHNGAYAEWNISGHVLIEITKTGGSNAVLSGIFFD